MKIERKAYLYSIEQRYEVEKLTARYAGGAHLTVGEVQRAIEASGCFATLEVAGLPLPIGLRLTDEEARTLMRRMDQRTPVTFTLTLDAEG